MDIVVNNKTESDSIANINITIEIGPSYLESELNLNFDYSLKISLRKPNINIFEINTDHKILCKSGKVEEEKSGLVISGLETISHLDFFMLYVILPLKQNDSNNSYHFNTKILNNFKILFIYF